MKWERHIAPASPTKSSCSQPALQEWSPDNLAYTPSDIMDTLNFSAITSVYEQESRGLRPCALLCLGKVQV